MGDKLTPAEKQAYQDEKNRAKEAEAYDKARKTEPDEKVDVLRVLGGLRDKGSKLVDETRNAARKEYYNLINKGEEIKKAITPTKKAKGGIIKKFARGGGIEIRGKTRGQIR